jgi:hypothetical protein
MHRTRWEEILKRDPMIRELGIDGRWARYTGGYPIWPLISIFKIKEDFNDPVVRTFKKRAIVCGVGSLICFIMLVFIIPYVASKQ